MTHADEAVDCYLASVLSDNPHPDIESVSIATEETAWCRVKVTFRDSSAIYIGIGGM